MEFLAVLRNFKGFDKRRSLTFVELESIDERDDELNISCVHKFSSMSALNASKT